MTAKIADLSGIEQVIPNIAALFNIEPSTALLLVGIVGLACNVVSRLIPDEATGWLGTVRTITKVIGVHVQDRVLTKVTITEMAADAVVTAASHKVPQQVKDYLDKAKELTSEVQEDSDAR